MNDPRILHALADLAEQVGRIAAALEAQQLAITTTDPRTSEGTCLAIASAFDCAVHLVDDDASAQQLAKLADQWRQDAAALATCAPLPADEVRQPTGLNRLLTEPTPAHLPGNIIVRPAQWSVWREDSSVYYGLATRDDATDTYSTYCGDGAPAADHPSLAAAVAYLIQRRTEDTEDAS